MSHPFKIAATMVCAALIGFAASATAQTTGEEIPPLPGQAAAAPASGPASTLPPLPLGHDGIVEVQHQLIALGFNPGPADGEVGPGTMEAVQRYNESRGGIGRVPVDSRLLARLQQDTGPRLTARQVAARAQPRSSAPANPLAGMMQQFEHNLRRMFNGG
ncbi:MAG TPA: peptidoglycan-binding domain-containing protein [Reyranella sp.]|nr:peptidoglycan-binding domain-containing protein [Reyranella sp.]